MPLPEPPPPITIHDVARVSGVSIKTVSRVLRDEPHVAAATRTAVHQAALQLGYVPHPSARNLASTVSNMVALVRIDPPAGVIGRAGHEYLMALQAGVQEVCQALDHGLMLLLVPRQPAAAAAEMQRLVRARQVGGFVLPAPSCDLPGLMAAMDAAGLCHAAISPARLDGASPWAVVDEADAMRRLAGHLIERGHRRIALMLGDAGTRGAEQRLAGYRQALGQAGIPFEPAWVEQASYTYDAGREAAHRLLRRPQRPSAIMAASDDCAAGVITAAHERGLVLPDDLSITGYDDVDLARKVWPSLSTVRQPIEQLAAIATRQLIARMHPQRRSHDAPAEQVTLQAELVLRGSVSTLSGA